jgi:hypothetical protein
MHEAMPPFPNTPSWRGAQFKEKSTGTALLTLLFHRCRIHPQCYDDGIVQVNVTCGNRIDYISLASSITRRVDGLKNVNSDFDSTSKIIVIKKLLVVLS